MGIFMRHLVYHISERIGNTISINPGSGESLQAVTFEIDKNGKIASLSHTLYGKLMN